MTSKVITFIREIRAELSKVTWPTPKHLAWSTLVVIVVSLIFAVIIGAMDAGWSFVIRWILSKG